MQVVNVGKKYEIYGDGLKTFDKLPSAVYSVRFSKMSGFYLEKHSDIEVNESKIYGVHDAKIQKVLRSYYNFTRNLGIILSGDKGMGKSLFAKLLAIECVKIGLPVIIVDEYIPSIASYISEIEQECLVLFDEFDKTFADRKNDDVNPQNELLTLLDGMEQGKKMYAITCNDISKLSNYFISRTGRFHYHIRFEYPTPDEVEVYLKDKLDSVEYHIEIPKIVNFSLKTNLNYDSLRAIAFEINSGETFESAIKDLNIMKSDREVWEVVLTCNNGKSYRDSKYLDLFSDERICVDFSVNRTYVEVRFNIDDIIMNNITGVGFVDINSDDVDFEWDTEDEECVKNMKGIEFVGLSVGKKNMQDKYRFTV